jgi:cytosine/adenosine deaminase-related metal-dependent hydrolase
LERAVGFAETVREIGSDRVRPYLFPYTLDTCSPELSQRANAEDDRLGIHLRTDFTQSEREVETIRGRHGASPVYYLEDLGVLDRNLILAHAIYPAGKDGTPHADGPELDHLADRGITVSHEPLVFVRRGIALDPFSRYRVGVNMAIGTDTFPHDPVSVLRWAASAGKTVERRADMATGRELFDNATLGGA